MAQSGLGTAPAKEKAADPGATYGGTATATSPAVQAPQQQMADSSLAVNSTTAKIQRASIRFFIVTGVSLVEALFFSITDAKLAAACGLVAVIFGVLGALTYRLNKGAVLVGMFIYAAETALLVVHGWNTSMITVGYAVLVHCAIIYRLYLSYGMICDLPPATA